MKLKKALFYILKQVYIMAVEKKWLYGYIELTINNKQ